MARVTKKELEAEIEYLERRLDFINRRREYYFFEAIRLAKLVHKLGGNPEKDT